MLKRRPCILGAHQKTSLGLQDKGQLQQQRNLSCSLLYPIHVSGWDVREEGGLEDEAALLHSASLWSAQSPHSEYTSIFWLMGNFSASQGIKERMQCSLKL